MAFKRHSRKYGGKKVVRERERENKQFKREAWGKIGMSTASGSEGSWFRPR